jgi:hypothetical protein
MLECCIDLLGDMELTEPERRVVDAASRGATADFREAGDAVATGGAWGPERTVRAEVLVELLSATPTEGRQLRVLSVAGARITGQIDLEAMSLLRPLVLHDCWLEQPVILDEAKAPRVDFSGCRLTVLRARQLETRGDLTLDRLVGTTGLLLEGARVGGALRIRWTKISRPGRRVINGDRLDVHVEMNCEGLKTDGEVCLAGAHIGGRLIFAGAHLANAQGEALDAEGLQVDQDVFCPPDSAGQRFEANGELRLLGAHIGGRLSLTGARLANTEGPALNADGSQVGQGIFCRTDAGGQRFEADSELRLRGAHIGGLILNGARLANAHGPTLHADGLKVEQNVFCRTDAGGQRFEGEGELRLVGAHVGGQLSLTGARLSNAHGPAMNGDGLRVDKGVFCQTDEVGQRFEADGELRMLGAHIGGELSLIGARLDNAQGHAFSGDGLQVDHSIFCQTDARGQRFAADGQLRLRAAHIGGVLSLIGARLANARSPALHADELRVAESVFCQPDPAGQRFEASGELRLLGAHIGGQLSLVGARLANPQGQALIGDGLQVGQDVFCRTDGGGQRFEADGELRLIGAQIGDQLSLIGAHVANARGRALNADGLQVGQILCWPDGDGQRFEAEGELRLFATRISGGFNLTGARLSNPGGPTLGLQRGHVGRLTLPRLADDAEVDLSHAVTRELYDDPRPAPEGEQGYRARLAGLMYDSLGPEADDREARLAWIARATDGYVPQAYDQLASVFRRAGRDDDAKKVMIAKQVRRRETLSPLGKAASYAFGLTLGYGYRTSRAAAALVAVVLIGWHVFQLAYPSHMTATRTANQLPHFNALLYSLDAVLPVVTLGQESAWSPQGVAQAWYGFSILAGWLLGLGLVAFLTARFFRE